MSSLEGMVILAANSGYEFAKRVYDRLKDDGCTWVDVGVDLYADELTRPQIQGNINGKYVVVFQSFSYGYEPGRKRKETEFMELLMLLDAVKRAHPREITAYVPLNPWGREDKKEDGRIPLSAQLFYKLIGTASKLDNIGLSKLITADLHSPTQVGFADYAIDNLPTWPLQLARIISATGFDPNKTALVSPDAGGVKRVRNLAKKLRPYIDGKLLPIVIIDKDRPEPNAAEVCNVIGNVGGLHAFVLDDIIDTAGTLIGGSLALRKRGAQSVMAGCTHLMADRDPKLNVFTEERLYHAQVPIIATNSIPRSDRYRGQAYTWLTTLDLAPYVAEVLRRNFLGQSVSEIINCMPQEILAGKFKLQDLILPVTPLPYP